MATLTATLDDHGIDYAKGIVTGTFNTTDGGAPTVDQIVLLPTSAYITAFEAVCEDGLGNIRASRNVNSAGTAANGTVLIQSNDPTTRGYHFIAHFKGS